VRCRAASPHKGKARVRVVPLDLGDDPEVLHRLALRLVDPTDATGFGRVDVLVNNGGVGSRSSVVNTSLATDIHVMNVNFLSAVALTKVRALLYAGHATAGYFSSLQHHVATY
jgi:NAD(P)-dependent dehydrogenase (short-subunit alcohol dehydrogenase family)